MTSEPASIELQRPDRSALTRALRARAELLCLPHMCSRATCQRAQCCRGEPRMCMARYAPLVPEEVRDGVEAFFEGRRRKLDFDAAREQFPALDYLITWHELVTSCRRAGGEPV